MELSLIQSSAYFSPKFDLSNTSVKSKIRLSPNNLLPWKLELTGVWCMRMFTVTIYGEATDITKEL